MPLPATALLTVRANVVCTSKVAKTKVVPVIVTVQGPVLAQPAGPITRQPVNTELEFGVAVSVTGVPKV